MARREVASHDRRGFRAIILTMSSDLAPRIADHFAEVFRRMGEGPGGVEFNLELNALRFITRTAHPFGNFVIADGGIGAEELRTTVAPLTEVGQPASVFLKSEASDSAIATTLKELGFENFGSMPLMAVDLGHLAPAALPSGFEFRRVGESERDAWVDALAEGYEIPVRLSELCASIDGGEIALYGAFEGDRVVSTSMTFAYDGMMGIYCVATRPSHRGKGLGAYVTAEPLHRARAEGWDMGILQASEAGFPIYKKLGFEEVGGIAMYFRMVGV